MTRIYTDSARVSMIAGLAHPRRAYGVRGLMMAFLAGMALALVIGG